MLHYITLHTRNHKSEIPLENATESPYGNSSKNPLDERQSFGTYNWQVKFRWSMPLESHWKMPQKIHDDFWGVDLWCAIFCPLLCRDEEGPVALRLVFSLLAPRGAVAASERDKHGQEVSISGVSISEVSISGVQSFAPNKVIIRASEGLTRSVSWSCGVEFLGPQGIPLEFRLRGS